LSALWKDIKKQLMNNWWSGRVEARAQVSTENKLIILFGTKRYV
jgi:hypothetical protein